MSAWREGKLGDFLELKRGYDLPAQDRSPGGFPIVSSSGITGSHHEARARGPGVVTGRYGTIGQVFFLGTSFWPLNTTLYVRDFKGNDPRFIAYFLRTIDFNAFVDKAAVPGVNRNHVHAAHVRIPVVDIQRRIAALLGALDDKIELNRRMNETLRKAIRLLFGQLIRGETYEASVADVARYVNGRNFTRDASGDGRMVIRIAEFKSGPGTSTVFSDAEAPDEHVARFGDILFAWSGSLGVYRWYADDALINQHIFKVVPNGYPVWFVHQHLLRALPFFRDTAADKATTMGHIKRSHLGEAKVEIPSEAALAGASEVIEPLDDRIAANERESRTLAALRDALLPKLISGELRIRDAERTVEETT